MGGPFFGISIDRGRFVLQFVCADYPLNIKVFERVVETAPGVYIDAESVNAILIQIENFQISLLINSKFRGEFIYMYRSKYWARF